MEKLRNLSGGLVKGCRTVLVGMSVAFMTALVVIVFSSVISRYFLNTSIAWAEEVSRIILIWMVFIGAIIAYGYKEHLGLDFVVNLLPARLRDAVAVVSNGLILYALWLMYSGGVKLTVNNWDSLTPALEMPGGIMYLAVPIAAVLMGIMTVYNLAFHAAALFAAKKA